MNPESTKICTLTVRVVVIQIDIVALVQNITCIPITPGPIKNISIGRRAFFTQNLSLVSIYLERKRWLIESP